MSELSFLIPSLLGFLFGLLSPLSSKSKYLSFIFFIVSSIARGEWGSDYEIYEDVFYGDALEGAAGSSLFEALLRILHQVGLPYQNICLINVILSFIPLLFMGNNMTFFLLTPVAASISFFNIMSYNFTKSGLVLSLLGGIILPLLSMLLIPKLKSSLISFQRKIILTLLLILTAVCGQVQMGVTASMLIFSVFALIMIRLYPFVLRLPRLRTKITTTAIVFLLAVSSISALFGFFIFTSARYLDYLSLVGSDSAAFYNVTQRSPVIVHAFPYLNFGVFLFFLLRENLFSFSARAGQYTGTISRLWISSPLFLIGLTYLLIGQIPGINPNAIGRTSIIFSALSCFYLLIIPLKFRPLLFSTRLRKFLIIGIVCIPLLYRGLSSYRFAMSLL